jgi:hypothetical protein
MSTIITADVKASSGVRPEVIKRILETFPDSDAQKLIRTVFLKEIEKERDKMENGTSLDFEVTKGRIQGLRNAIALLNNIKD